MEFVHTCLIGLDEMMTSLESEVSALSLSDSATIKNKQLQLQKKTRADYLEITEWHMFIIYATFLTCVSFFNN